MSTLTSEQRDQIERNRLSAIQRRKEWNHRQQQQATVPPNAQHPSYQTFRKRKRKFRELQEPPNSKRVPLYSILKNSISSHKTNDTNSTSPLKKRRKLFETNENQNHQIESKTSSTSASTPLSFKQASNKPSKRRKKHKKPKNNMLITNYFNGDRQNMNKRSKSRKNKTKRSKKSRNTKQSKKCTQNMDSNTHNNWIPLHKHVLFDRLSHSKFRSKFKLGIKEIKIANTKNIESHAFDFVTKRLSAAYPTNDGKQTPMRGHPVFIAQHATATCCRTCLSKWHYIQTGRKLNNQQIIYMVEVIVSWIQLQLKTQSVTR